MATKYRADQVGSLLRPKELLDLRKDPNVAPDDLRAMEEQQILRMLAKQKELGFKIFTDGELRRHGFMSDFHESVEGLDMQGAIDRSWQNAGKDAPTTPTSRPVAGIVVDNIEAVLAGRAAPNCCNPEVYVRSTRPHGAIAKES